MQKKGFTLIELLVVIAIIALLMSIIMPALSKAKTYAEETVCKSNIRQYLLATQMYANDHGDKLPNAWESLYSKINFLDETERYCRWHNPAYDLEAYADKKDSTGSDGKAYAGPYWPYLSVTKANVCPTFSKLAPKYGESHYSSCIGGSFEPQFSYSMNSIFRGTQKITNVKSPSRTFLWAEENMWLLTGLSAYVLNDNALKVYNNGNPGVDSFGSFHKISKGKLNIQRMENRYDSNTGVANVILVDGSVTWATPEDSADYVGETR